MHHILVYSDSLTWGIIPATRQRLPFEARWPGVPVPPILIVAPPPIDSPKGPIARKFVDATSRSARLAAALRETAAEHHCHFFDAGTVTPASTINGIHLDRDQHATLGNALAGFIAGPKVLG